MKSILTRICGMSILLSLPGLPAAATDITLVSSGVPDCSIVLADAPNRAAAFAAHELQDFVERITGATVPIVSESSASGGTLILVGESSWTRALGYENADFESQEYLVRYAETNRIVLMGRDKTDTGAMNYADYLTFPKEFDDQGTAYAVYDFLEQACGVRTFWATDVGLGYEPRDTLTVTMAADIRRAPFFKLRSALTYEFPANLAVGRTTPPAGLEEYAMQPRRESELYWRRMRRGGRPFAAGHSFYTWATDHPAWYGFGYPAGTKAQPCMSNPDVVDHLVTSATNWFDSGVIPPDMPAGLFVSRDRFPIVPDDNSNYCTCDNCQAKRHPSSIIDGWGWGDDSASELVFGFIRDVAERLQVTHPTKFVSTLAYGDYSFPPSFVVPSNVEVMVCLTTRMWNMPLVERIDRMFFDAWTTTAQSNRPIYVAPYMGFPAHACTFWNPRFYCFPGFSARMSADQMRLFRDRGVQGFVFQDGGWNLFWGSYRYSIRESGVVGLADQLDMYVWYRMLDNPDLDTETLLADYFDSYYGNAANSMACLYEELECAYTNAANYPPAIANGSAAQHQDETIAWGWLGTEARMDSFEALMQQALVDAVTDLEQERVGLFMEGVWGHLVGGRNLYVYHQWKAANPISPRTFYARKIANVSGGNPSAVVFPTATAMNRFETMTGESADRGLAANWAFDDNYLYFEFKEATNPASLVTSWDLASGDCWELYLAKRRYGVGGPHPYQRLIFANTNDHVVFLYNASNQYSRAISAQVYSDTAVSTQWTVRVSLPLSQVMPDGLKSGWVVYFNVVRSTAKRELYGIQPASNGLRDPSHMRSLWLDCGY